MLSGYFVPRDVPRTSLEQAPRASILRCSKEVRMGILELMAGAFIVSVPALVLADVFDERSARDE